MLENDLFGIGCELPMCNNDTYSVLQKYGPADSSEVVTLAYDSCKAIKWFSKSQVSDTGKYACVSDAGVFQEIHVVVMQLNVTLTGENGTTYIERGSNFTLECSAEPVTPLHYSLDNEDFLAARAEFVNEARAMLFSKFYKFNVSYQKKLNNLKRLLIYSLFYFRIKIVFLEIIID